MTAKPCVKNVRDRLILLRCNPDFWLFSNSLRECDQTGIDREADIWFLRGARGHDSFVLTPIAVCVTAAALSSLS